MWTPLNQNFLKALGYLSTFDRPAELDERIQMHADKLYHRMLDQERAIEAAKAADKPIPSFPPIIPSSAEALRTTTSSTSSSTDKHITADQLSPEVQKLLKKRLKGLGPKEREVEERAIAAEIAAGERLGRQIGDIHQENDKAKRERKAQGKQTVGDQISSLFGW